MKKLRMMAAAVLGAAMIAKSALAGGYGAPQVYVFGTNAARVCVTNTESSPIAFANISADALSALCTTTTIHFVNIDAATNTFTNTVVLVGTNTVSWAPTGTIPPSIHGYRRGILQVTGTHTNAARLLVIPWYP